MVAASVSCGVWIFMHSSLTWIPMRSCGDVGQRFSLRQIFLTCKPPRGDFVWWMANTLAATIQVGWKSRFIWPNMDYDHCGINPVSVINNSRVFCKHK